MDTKLRKFWSSLDRNILVNKRELFLEMTVCTLTGVLVGILLSPKRTTTIGSYNGNGAASGEAGETASSTPDRKGA